MDNMPKTYVLWFGSVTHIQVYQYPYHLGTQLSLAKQILSEKFKLPAYAEYQRASLFLGNEYIYGVRRSQDDGNSYPLNSDRERFNSRQ